MKRISEKLADLKNTRHKAVKTNAAELNDLKLKIKAIEKLEKQLTDTILTGGFNEDLLKISVYFGILWIDKFGVVCYNMNIKRKRI